jgi:hypothetical protein
MNADERGSVQAKFAPMESNKRSRLGMALGPTLYFQWLAGFVPQISFLKTPVGGELLSKGTWYGISSDPIVRLRMLRFWRVWNRRERFQRVGDENNLKIGVMSQRNGGMNMPNPGEQPVRRPDSSERKRAPGAATTGNRRAGCACGSVCRGKTGPATTRPWRGQFHRAIWLARELNSMPAQSAGILAADPASRWTRERRRSPPRAQYCMRQRRRLSAV